MDFVLQIACSADDRVCDGSIGAACIDGDVVVGQGRAGALNENNKRR